MGGNRYEKYSDPLSKIQNGEKRHNEKLILLTE